MDSIKVIAFDADDTLWENQPQFNEVITEFTEILRPYCPEKTAYELIHKIQVENLTLYGFGAKSLTLSMMQVACKLSNNQIGADDFEKILQLGKKLLTYPVTLLDNVENIVKQLKEKYRLILITKGDLVEQKRKLQESGLLKYFHHIEILSDKRIEDYKELFTRLNLKPEEFVMIGNSLKSDIIPVLELNAKAIFIPYHSTWEHENIENYEADNKNFTEIEKLSDLIKIFT